MLGAPRRPVAAGTLFTSVVREHVGDFASFARFNLSHLIKAEEGVAVLFRDSFEPIARRPPRLHEAERAVAATPNAARQRAAAASSSRHGYCP